MPRLSCAPRLWNPRCPTRLLSRGTVAHLLRATLRAFSQSLSVLRHGIGVERQTRCFTVRPRAPDRSQDYEQTHLPCAKPWYAFCCSITTEYVPDYFVKRFTEPREYFFNLLNCFTQLYLSPLTFSGTTWHKVLSCPQQAQSSSSRCLSLLDWLTRISRSPHS